MRCATIVADTVRGAQVVVSVVLTDDQLRSVCLGPDGVLSIMDPGATLVQHTTCDPVTVALLGDEAQKRGSHVLDAALSGGPHDIASGRLTLWVGGEAPVLDAVRSLLAAYASPIVFVGSLGDGQRVKLVNNALFVAQVGLAIDAVRIAGGLGIAEDVVLAALQHGSGASRALGVVASGGTVESVRARIGALMSKDVNTVGTVANRAGVDLGIIGEVIGSKIVRENVLS